MCQLQLSNKTALYAMNVIRHNQKIKLNQIKYKTVDNCTSSKNVLFFFPYFLMPRIVCEYVAPRQRYGKKG